MVSTTPRRLTFAESAVLLIAAGLLLWQLFVPPRVGMGDNGDFARVMGRFTIGYPPGVAEQTYARYFVRSYEVSPELRWKSPFLTSETALVWLSLAVNRLISPAGTYDLRALGLIHGCFFLGCLVSLVIYSRRWEAAPRWLILVLTVLIFTDTAYLAYFQSFYSEPATLLFLLATVMALFATGSNPSMTGVLIFALMGVGLVLAKPQNAPAGLVLALLAARLIPLSSRRIIRVCASAAAIVLLVSSIISYRSTPQRIREWAYEISVFWQILGRSSDPESDLRALGLDTDLARYKGLNPWSEGAPRFDDPEFRRTFVDVITARRIALFYLQRPGRIIPLINDAGYVALRGRPQLGNYERSAGFPAGTVSHKFDRVSVLKARFLPRKTIPLLIFFGSAITIFILVWFRARGREMQWIAEVILGVLVIGVTQFLLVAMILGDFDAPRVMFFFRITVDILIIGIAGVVAFEVASLSALALHRKSRNAHGEPSAAATDAS